jgi:hypothetical protein
MRSQVTPFVSRRWRVPRGAVSVAIERLHGGLESAVARAYIRYERPRADQPSRLVIKALHGRLAREADVYDALRVTWPSADRPGAEQRARVQHVRCAAAGAAREHRGELFAAPRGERKVERAAEPSSGVYVGVAHEHDASLHTGHSRVIRTRPACRPRDPDAL